MSADPATRQARRIIRLVVIAVVLPSLLLTGMGILAVTNEETAAKERLKKTYEPITLALAKRFNAEIDALVTDSAEPLEALVAWADDPSLAPTAVSRFLERHPFAVNFFVIDAGGRVLVPAVRAIPAAAAAKLEPVLAALGPSESATKVPVETLVEQAQALVRLLADPSVATSLRGREAAHTTAERLGPCERMDACRMRLALESIEAWQPLVEHLARMMRPSGSGTVLGGYNVDGWRRVVVTREIDGKLAGFELVPCLFTGFLQHALHEIAECEGIDVEVMPVEYPKSFGSWLQTPWVEGLKDKDIDWVFLSKSDLAWDLGLLDSGASGLASLRHSRVPLYLWGLVLIVAALAAGIGLTVRGVLHEARASRLKTDFVSSVSHDLRTPLTSIRMFTETLLLGRVKSRQEERECLEVIAQETERLSRLTERILDFARMEAGRKPYAFAPTEVAPLVERALAACRPLIEEAGFAVTLDIAPDLPPIEADSDALIEALINLIGNAVKYSPEHKQIRLTAAREGEGVALAVADRGIGIPKTEQQHIFEMFYRVDCRRTSEVGGSGIGLSLVKHIVEAHQGSITVDSTPGHGSIFTLHLRPRVPPAHGPAHGEVGLGEHPDRRR